MVITQLYVSKLTERSICLQRANFTIYKLYLLKKSEAFELLQTQPPVFKFSFSQPSNLHRCLKDGLRNAGWPYPTPTLYYSGIFFRCWASPRNTFWEMSEKMKCDQSKSISQLPVVEGSLPWPSSIPGASEGFSHGPQARSPAGHRPLSSVLPVLCVRFHPAVQIIELVVNTLIASSRSTTIIY